MKDQRLKKKSKYKGDERRNVKQETIGKSWDTKSLIKSLQDNIIRIDFGFLDRLKMNFPSMFEDKRIVLSTARKREGTGNTCVYLKRKQMIKTF